MEAPAFSLPDPEEPVGDDTAGDEQRSSADRFRAAMEQWVEISEVSPFDPIPPIFLREYIWGWERLLPDVHGSVEWNDYKTYLVQYLQKNALKVATGEDALRDAVSSCIEAERRLIRICHSFLSYEELCLTDGIKNQARYLLQSDGEYPAAAATLLAITKEAELMCEMKIKGYTTSAVRALAHQIRQAAFKLILYGGSESAAVTAAMVGLEEASKVLIDELREDGSSAFTIFYQNVKMRQGIAKVLTKLGEEVACETTSNAGTLTSAMKKLIGSSTELNKQCERDSETGNKKTSKSLHNVIEEGGHALKNNETETKAVAFSPPLRVDEPTTHGWVNEDVQTQGMEKHSSHQHVQRDRHKKRSSHQRLENSGRQCLGTELQHDHSKTINLSDNDEDEQENSDGNTSSRSGATGPSRGRSKRRNDAKPVPRIEETMSDFMSFKREPAATKAQNKCQGQEFSMTSCLAVLKDMVDLSDDVKIQASEVFKDPLSREIFLGYETRLRALWLTKEVNKLGTLSNAS